MGRVFGEDSPNDPLDAELDAYILKDPILSLDDGVNQSVCLNIRDDRLAPPRSRESFRDFQRTTKQAHLNASLEYCLAEYHRVQVRKAGEFLRYSNPCDPINPGELLVRVFNLSGVFDSLDLFLRSPEFRAWPLSDRKVFNDYPNNCVGYTDWLSHRMLALGYERILDLILKALAIQGEKSPYRPCWVTLWNRFSKHIADGANWWRFVGVKPPIAGDWFVLLAHRAGDASPLFTPCQLYAGWYGYYYPAPERARCGYAMEILCRDDSTRPLEEFIHGEIAPSLDQWKAAGEVRPHPAAGVSYSLDDHRNDRATHLRRLRHVV